MLKIITEKEKITFVYDERTIPIILYVVGVLGLGAGIAAMGTLTPQNLVVLLVGPIAAFLTAYIILSRKQILVIDGVRKTVEEHLGKKGMVFNFEDIEYADVERVKDEENPDPPHNLDEAAEDEEKAEEEKIQARAKPQLNYHPFVSLKEGDRYFFFDNKGEGINNYKSAKSMVEAINQYIGVPKMTCGELNLYRIKPKQNFTLILLVAALAGLSFIAYLLLLNPRS